VGVGFYGVKRNKNLRIMQCLQGWNDPVKGGQGGIAPLRTSFSDRKKLSSANYLK